MKLEKTTLEGEHVKLEPLSQDHHAGLCEAIADGELWKLFVTRVPAINKIEGFIDQALSEYDAGQSLAFATIHKQSGEIAGSTRFMRIDKNNKRLEIGFTFIAQRFQRTVINTEAKLLMLKHAFEQLKVNRVEFLTDYLNQTSRQAILRLGAKQEGILRNHMLMPDGRVRDSVLFSIIANEWPGIQQNLLFKLAARS